MTECTHGRRHGLAAGAFLERTEAVERPQCVDGAFCDAELIRRVILDDAREVGDDVRFTPIDEQSLCLHAPEHVVVGEYVHEFI